MYVCMRLYLFIHICLPLLTSHSRGSAKSPSGAVSLFMSIMCIYVCMYAFFVYTYMLTPLYFSPAALQSDQAVP